MGVAGGTAKAVYCCLRVLCEARRVRRVCFQIQSNPTESDVFYSLHENRKKKKAFAKQWDGLAVKVQLPMPSIQADAYRRCSRKSRLCESEEHALFRLVAEASIAECKHRPFILRCICTRDGKQCSSVFATADRVARSRRICALCCVSCAVHCAYPVASSGFSSFPTTARQIEAAADTLGERPLPCHALRRARMASVFEPLERKLFLSLCIRWLRLCWFGSNGRIYCRNRI